MLRIPRSAHEAIWVGCGRDAAYIVSRTSGDLAIQAAPHVPIFREELLYAERHGVTNHEAKLRLRELRAADMANDIGYRAFTDPPASNSSRATRRD